MTVGPPTPEGSSVGLLEQPFGGLDPAGPGNGAPDPAPDAASRGRLARFVLGRERDPVWVRPALLTLLALTAVLYLWDLGASGWGNSFYSAAVQAGTKSWKAFFFGSSDSSNFITVDKPPASLWVMELSARIFGFNSWSILVPQALEGVATVGVVYLTVRRWFTAQAALLAGAVVALTPAAAIMFRFNNPDSLLALLLAGSMYALVRGLEKAQTRWLVLAGTLVGFGFITKMLQAFLIIPALVIVYLLAAPTGWWRRVWQVAVMGVATLVAGGWWVAAVTLTPAADRPYIGGSQNNSVLNLIFGYNGFGRLTGSESGSVVGGGGAGSAGQWGPTGLLRLFNTSFGNMMSWLLPGALLMGAVLLVLTIRARRTDRERAALLLFGGALVGTGLVISLGQGIIHPYYTVALAAPLGGLVGIGTMGLWQRRSTWAGRIGLAAALLATSIWGFVLLDRTPDWFPFLRFVVLVGGILGAAAILALPLLRPVPKLAVGLVAVLGLGSALVAPLFSTVATASVPHTGAIPTVTPTPAGGGGFGGGGFGGGRGPGGFPGFGRAGARHRRRARVWRRLPRWRRSDRRLSRGRNGPRHHGGWVFAQWAPRRIPGRLRRWRSEGGCRRRLRRWLPQLQQLESRPDQVAPGGRGPLHVGRGDRELQLGRGVSARQRRSGDGHRWVQRHGSGAVAVAVREVRVRGKDPLLHQRRRRGRVRERGEGR